LKEKIIVYDYQARGIDFNTDEVFVSAGAKCDVGNILDLFDYIIPCLALGQAIGRWGNFINVEAYGSITRLPWRMGIIEAGKYIEVHPTFLYESLVTFLIFILLATISNKRKYKGQITLIYLTIYSFARMIIEGMRTDSLMMGDMRISQLLSMLILIITVIITIIQNYKVWKASRMKE